MATMNMATMKAFCPKIRNSFPSFERGQRILNLVTRLLSTRQDRNYLNLDQVFRIQRFLSGTGCLKIQLWTTGEEPILSAWCGKKIASVGFHQWDWNLHHSELRIREIRAYRFRITCEIRHDISIPWCIRTIPVLFH